MKLLLRGVDGAELSIFSRLFEVLLPRGGLVVQMVEAYFDESGTHDGSPVLCLGGFVVESEAARRLDSDWERMLDKYHLPFFHMTDCANGADIFEPLGKQRRIDLATEAIQIIRNHMIAGRMVSVYPADYDAYAPDHELLGTAYSMCAHGCLVGVQHWADHNAFYGISLISLKVVTDLRGRLTES